MTKGFNPILLALAAISALAVSACSGGGSPRLDAGERIAARGSAISGRGEAWNDARRDVVSGEKTLRKSADRAADAEKDLRRARDAAAKAERQMQEAREANAAALQQIADGQARMRQAEAEYLAIRNQPSALQPR